MGLFFVLLGGLLSCGWQVSHRVASLVAEQGLWGMWASVVVILRPRAQAGQLCSSRPGGPVNVYRIYHVFYFSSLYTKEYHLEHKSEVTV